MTDKFGPGQADKRAAEQRTVQVGEDNKAEQGKAEEQNKASEASEAKSAAEKVAQADSGDEAVLVDPYPAYEDKDLDELRSEAKSRDVEINRDVEKAELVKLLREKDPSLAYDLMPLEDLRDKAAEADVRLPEEFERAHLVTELRAADTHTG